MSLRHYKLHRNTCMFRACNAGSSPTARAKALTRHTLVAFALKRFRAMTEDWKPKLKHYPHFDAPLITDEILSIVSDPLRVARNAFYPFLLYIDVQEKFGRQDPKKRPIRYACRRDAYIFAYYRHLLSQKYEEKLRNDSIDDVVIAYRKIPVTEGKEGGKCNIDFAKEAFREIKLRGDCYAVALDISSYFEKINHAKLKTLWCELMDFKDMPKDHEAVFKNITRYHEVDFDVVCEILGYKEKIMFDGIEKIGFRRDIPQRSFFNDSEYKQLCTPKEFKEKILPAKTIDQNGKLSNIIHENDKPYGIPQGSPISDLLANLFLINFDQRIKSYALKNNIYYRRYSDDILLILPKEESVLNAAIEFVKNEINQAGSELLIKDKKTHIKKFQENGDLQTCEPYLLPNIEDQHKGNNFEYLGFSYNGKLVEIKDSTVNRFKRKMLYGARREAAKAVKRYSDKSIKEILKKINFGNLYTKYGNVEDFDELDLSTLDGKKKLTFIAYAKRSEKVMSDFDTRISKQIAGHKKDLQNMLEKEVVEQWKKHRVRKNKAA